MTIQHFLFKRALEEENIEIKNFHIDHSYPKNYNNGLEYNFVFPKSFLKEIEQIPKCKKIDYIFLGTIKGNHRNFLKNWNKGNSLIKTSTENNFIHPSNDPNNYYGENYFNREYFKQLCSSKFTLCPGGCSAFDKKEYIDKNIFLWTYRFWEAVLCMSIPITNEPDLRLHKDYKYYSLEDEHVYNEEWANHNFNILKERHFIWIND